MSQSEHSQHVDLVKNEWLAGFQHVVARIYLEGRQLRLDSPDPDRWEHLIHQPQVDRATGDQVDPDSSGPEFFERLHTLLAGDYLFATEAHLEDDCPFQHELVVPIRPAQPEAELAH